MHRLSPPTLFALCLASCTPASPPAPSAPVVETLASYPHGAFLENLALRPDGAVIFTSYFDKRLMLLPPGGEASTLAQLPAHPVGVLRTQAGFIVTAHAIPFNDAPAFLSSNQVLMLDAAGVVIRTIPAPDARFLNGLVEIGPDKVLIADSAAGVIWALTPSSGSLAPWLRDPLLEADPAATEFRPAANGLKLRDGQLYVSNSSRGAIYRVALSADGAPSGALTTFATPGPVDDFAFAADGAIYAATHGAQLLRIAPDASFAPVITSGCDACTSVAIAGAGDRLSLIVLTTGNLLEGGDAPARVLRVTP
jgi:sugar lactone lactonase YvrE